MKILIAVPSMDDVPARFAQSLAMLRKVGECAISFQIGSLIYTSRNELAFRAIEMGADYVLWLDSDMVFDPDLLEKLVADMSEGVDMVSGVYYRRVPPFTPVMFDKMEMGDGKFDWSEFQDLPDKMFEAGAVGFGCVLMRTSVLMAVFAKFSDMFGPLLNAGEDIAFCWRARQCGLKVWVDPNIQAGHVTKTIVDQKFYKAYHGKA